MTNRDFKFWLHGFIEIGQGKTFTTSQICIIRDHLNIIEDEDKWTSWLRGVLDMAPLFNFTTDSKLYEIIKEELDQYFNKITPDRKEEIREEVDKVLLTKEFEDKLIKKLNEVPENNKIRPLVVGPAAPYIVDGTEKFAKTCSPSVFP